uniref:Uncharacterized protein n=1 Tax=Lepeophtheirus salmonis TaxID=72036 RepID=A0A0K2TBE0_LEPSM
MRFIEYSWDDRLFITGVIADAFDDSYYTRKYNYYVEHYKVQIPIVILFIKAFLISNLNRLK